MTGDDTTDNGTDRRGYHVGGGVGGDEGRSDEGDTGEGRFDGSRSGDGGRNSRGS